MSEPHDLSRGIRRFLQFHKLEVNKVGQFSDRLTFPRVVEPLGEGKWVAYRSDKWEARFHNYIHEHESPVRYYCPARSSARTVKVPETVLRARTLVLLGECLGFCYGDEPERDYARRSDRPDLYCTPSGKCLVIVQGKSRLLAMAWGGKLNVTERGIEG